MTLGPVGIVLFILDIDNHTSVYNFTVRQRHIHLNWSNFKPEFSGKPE